MAIGKPFASGRLDVEPVMSNAGSQVLKPRLVKTRFCASTEDILEGESLICQRDPKFQNHRSRAVAYYSA